MAVKHIRSQLKTALATGLDGVLRLALTERGNNLFTPFLGALPRSIRLPFSVPVKRLGVDMKVPLGGSGVNLNDTIEHLKWAGSWKSRVFERFVKRSQPTFVDIGANTGQTLLEIFATHPDARYIGFEPSLPCAAYLASVIEANRWAGSLILASALASEEGLVALYHGPGSITDSGATVQRDLRPGRKYDSSYVPCLRFDTVRDALKLDHIDLVKIDVEGGELEVVTGMEHTLESIRPIILCEVLSTDSAADIRISTSRNEELIRRLTRSGYSVWQLVKSDDLKDVQSIRHISEFPREYWSPANAELCDYLFLPRERYPQAVW